MRVPCLLARSHARTVQMFMISHRESGAQNKLLGGGFLLMNTLNQFQKGLRDASNPSPITIWLSFNKQRKCCTTLKHEKAVLRRAELFRSMGVPINVPSLTAFGVTASCSMNGNSSISPYLERRFRGWLM